MGGLSVGRAGCFLGEGSILVLYVEAEHLLDQAVSECDGSYRWKWLVMEMVEEKEERILLFYYKENPTIRAQ